MCVRLKKEWYRYLKGSGFEDIEQGIYLVGKEDRLHLSQDLNNIIKFEARRDYYLWAQEMATTNSFDSMIDKMIWDYHAEGYKPREIAPLLGYKPNTISQYTIRIEKRLKRA